MSKDPTIDSEVDTVCDDLVFKHEKREPAITDWCCLREQSVREAITNLIAQEANKARLDELKELNHNLIASHNKFIDDEAEMVDTDTIFQAIKEHLADRINALTADKEQADG